MAGTFCSVSGGGDESPGDSKPNGPAPARARIAFRQDRYPLCVRRHVMTEHHYRTERNPVGSVEIPDTALFGIHACRARGNFPGTDKTFGGQFAGGKKRI